MFFLGVYDIIKRSNMKKANKTIRIINWPFVTWMVLFIIAIVAFFIAINFVAFPTKYTLPLAAILALIVAIMGIVSLMKVKKKRNQKRTPRQITAIILNCILSAALLSVSIYLPILQAKMKGIFVEQKDTEEVRINAYVMTSDYKVAHSDVFTNTTTSTELSDYKDAKFITQSKIDQDNQAYALEDIQTKLEKSSLNIISKNDVLTAVSSLYDGTGDVLILNENYANSISDIPGYESFNTETQILYTVVKTVQVEKKEPTIQSYKNSSFMVFIAGSDSRSSELTLYTRTDVDILMTVDPVNKQIMLISMPRDWYVKNPALWNEYDKLTHLGNDGMQNTVDGLNQEYGFDYIKNYVEVNFVTFKNIIDSIGGVEIENPYAFSDEQGDVFPEGTIHLDGDIALNYVRDRHTLANGDYGRNEHQAIVLQAIIKKLTSKEIISNFNNLLEGLQGNFLTDMNPDDIYSLAAMQLNDGGSWKFINYHLGGVGDYNTTASMGDMQLYVSYPIEEQINFAKEQMTKMMNGEIVEQQELPANDETVYLPN